MEPLDAYEIQELMNVLDQGLYPIPIGSLWSNLDSTQMFMVLHHANLPTADGPKTCLVLQALPDGSAWIQPTEQFLSGGWQHVGFIWDRGVNV